MISVSFASSDRWKHGFAGVLVGGLMLPVAGAGVLRAQGLKVGPMPPTPVQVVQGMLAREDDISANRDHYEFLSNERSDRTGQHVWTERVAETHSGRVRMLLAVDGKPLSAEEQEKERGRLADLVAHPETFVASEQTAKDDEAHARKLLDMLPVAFVFDNVRLEDGVWRMDFHPNPAYSPHGIEDRVMYGMSGSVRIDAEQQRLAHIDGKLQEDVAIGFGLVATVRAGSHFSSDRADKGGHWRTVHVLTALQGKAVLFKSVSRDSEITRSEFHYLEQGMTIAQAVALVESSADGEVLRGRREIRPCADGGSKAGADAEGGEGKQQIPGGNDSKKSKGKGKISRL